MSKYDLLWQYVQESGSGSLKLTFTEIEKILRIPIDHSFLTDKKELTKYGYRVGKISMKEQTVMFVKTQKDNRRRCSGQRGGRGIPACRGEVPGGHRRTA